MDSKPLNTGRPPMHTDSAELRARVDGSPMSRMQWSAIVVCMLLNVLDGFDVLVMLGRRASYEERLRACQLIESGKSPDLVAEILGFGRATVFGWLQDYRALGPEGLRTKKTRGPAAKGRSAAGAAV
ncbi:helix-turn-helix domain-containing protein [Nonomuraea sp. SYSU D8015]|uniref:helix-turn-helix domain-containing protein n=1 Tax=Nonomuraea sp. SYSU D8015 TaxID=2593644 RepID=UPI001CB751A7|nr:helix-turn-helix domain-containing protein [Nonomuraea sp. SYSU D8015]